MEIKLHKQDGLQTPGTCSGITLPYAGTCSGITVPAAGTCSGIIPPAAGTCSGIACLMGEALAPQPVAPLVAF
jgi:hypothetical protein